MLDVIRHHIFEVYLGVIFVWFLLFYPCKWLGHKRIITKWSPTPDGGYRATEFGCFRCHTGGRITYEHKEPKI